MKQEIQKICSGQESPSAANCWSLGTCIYLLLTTIGNSAALDGALI